MTRGIRTIHVEHHGVVVGDGAPLHRFVFRRAFAQPPHRLIDVFIADLRRLLAQQRWQFATRVSRRSRPRRNGSELDLRRLAARAARSGGVLLTLPRRARKIRQRPLVVALPEDEAQVQAVLKACHALEVPVVARGAGTGLSGGAMPHALGVTLSLAKFNRIRGIDPVSRTAVVECGVRNLAISEAAASYGLYYAPDPSSQIACTIGGNVAENSGGVHCLKYGLTLHNVLKVRGFTAEGEPVEFGHPLFKVDQSQ